MSSYSFFKSPQKTQKIETKHRKIITPISADGNLIELLYFNTHTGEKIKREMIDIGLTHLAFTVKDLDKDYKHLKPQGIKFYSPPQINPEETAKVAFCEDPHGNIMELV